MSAMATMRWGAPKGSTERRDRRGAAADEKRRSLAEEHVRLGNTLRSVRRDYKAAEAEYAKAVEVDPNNAEVRTTRALAREARARGDVDAEREAEQELRQQAGGAGHGQYG